MASIEDRPKNINSFHSIVDVLKHKCVTKVKDIFPQYQLGNLTFTPKTCWPEKIWESSFQALS